MIEAKGSSGSFVLDGKCVTIFGKGALAGMTIGKGEKRIPISSITAVQWKPAGPLVNGFVQFTVPEGREKRSAFGGQLTESATDTSLTQECRACGCAVTCAAAGPPVASTPFARKGSVQLPQFSEPPGGTSGRSAHRPPRPELEPGGNA